MASIAQSLDATRAGYDEEGRWMRLLLDGYRGSGGFQGRVKQPAAGFWGSAAEAYSAYSIVTLLSAGAGESTTYLDRYPREDVDKFQRRVQVAHYLNYLKPTTNLKISYIVRKPHRRNNVPTELQKWIESSGYDKGLRRRALVAAVCGWFPLCVDMPKKPRGAVTAAQAGKMDPYTVLRLPLELIAYETDYQGAFVWAKFRTCFKRQPTWDAEPQDVTRYTVWTRNEFIVWEGTGSGEPIEVDRGQHPFGAVPVVSWRTDANVDDPVKADSINAELINEARRLFNLVSELDETLRGNVFPLLLVPSAPGMDEGAGGGNEKQVGTENGLTISPDQKNLPQFIAPPASVCETYETRIEKTIVEIYRMARVEYTKAEGTRTSAQSKEANFNQTNLAIVDFAQSLANADRDTLILVGRGLGISEDKLQAIECVAHDSYSEGELNDEIEQIVQMVTDLPVGNTAKGELTKRLLWRALNGIGAKARAVIESEVDEAVMKAEQEAELTAQAERDALNKEPPPPSGGDDTEDDDDAEASGGNT